MTQLHAPEYEHSSKVDPRCASSAPDVVPIEHRSDASGPQEVIPWPSRHQALIRHDTVFVVAQGRGCGTCCARLSSRAARPICLHSATPQCENGPAVSSNAAARPRDAMAPSVIRNLSGCRFAAPPGGVGRVSAPGHPISRVVSCLVAANVNGRSTASRTSWRLCRGRRAAGWPSTTASSRARHGRLSASGTCVSRATRSGGVQTRCARRS